MSERDWSAEIERIIDGPCVGCYSPEPGHHVAMPVTRPKSVDPYLEQIAGPDEQHNAGGDCINPKCDYQFTPEDHAELATSNGDFTCPNPGCGLSFNYYADQRKSAPDQPGGYTRAQALTMDEMGGIGEEVALRLGELPGIGAIQRANTGTLQARDPAGRRVEEPLDAIVQGSKGTFGCEIKTNHSQAQERFKIGGKAERAKKIAYCYQNGLKPALIGVRLNFYTDKAYVFFREGLTDTWVGNPQMIHVATVDFADLNPFKSPDPQAQALAVENAHLPDQSEDEFPEFGHAASWSKEGHPDFDESQHPRDAEGKFTFSKDVHELKVLNKQGKHTHTARHCKHCGHVNFVPVESTGRMACSTCGEDLDRVLREARVILAGPTVDQMANQFGFQFVGRTGQGHRKYAFVDPSGVEHAIVVGSGAHGKRALDIDAQRARQRMTRCLNGQCMHGGSESIPQTVEPGKPMFYRGQTVAVNGTEQFVMDIQGDVALVLDPHTGIEDVVSIEQMRATGAEKKPEFMFVYYMGRLLVEEYHHNKRFQDLIDRLFEQAGQDIEHSFHDLDPTQFAAGEIFEFEDGSVRVEHKQLAHEDVRTRADDALQQWLQEKQDVFEDELPRDPDTGQFVSEDDWIAS